MHEIAHHSRGIRSVALILFVPYTVFLKKYPMDRFA